MDAAQRQHFNDKGWLVVPGVLGTDLLSRLNPVYDAELRSSWDGKVLAHGWANSGSARPAAERLAGRVLWGEAMYELINPPKLVPILEQLLGEPELGHALPGAPVEYRRQFYLDHDNTHWTPPFDPEFPNRGEPLEQKADFGASQIWTEAGWMRGSARGLPGLHGGHYDPPCMLTVSYELLPIEAGEGGTACISGSHKPSFESPDLTDRHMPPWPEEFGVELITTKPGDCLIFTEKLVHSTFPYSGAGQRRTMFMKYQPYGTDRMAGNYTIKYDLSRPELTDDQRRILAWPDQWEEFGLGDYGPGGEGIEQRRNDGTVTNSAGRPPARGVLPPPPKL